MLYFTEGSFLYGETLYYSASLNDEILQWSSGPRSALQPRRTNSFDVHYPSNQGPSYNNEKADLGSNMKRHLGQAYLFCLCCIDILSHFYGYANFISRKGKFEFFNSYTITVCRTFRSVYFYCRLSISFSTVLKSAENYGTHSCKL